MISQVIDPTSNNNYNVFQGRTFTSNVTYFGPDGVTPVDLTGSTCAGTVGINGVDQALTCIITDPVNGKINIGLSNTQTVAMAVGQYRYEVNITFPSGTISSLLFGRFIVLALGY